MLTKSDLQWNHLAFQYASKLGLIPVTFDPTTGQMEFSESIKRQIIFKTWESLLFCHLVYVKIRTIQAFIVLQSSEDPDPNYDLLPIMLILSIGLDCFFSVVFSVFEGGHGSTNVKIYNEIFKMLGKNAISTKFYYMVK